MKSLLAFFLLVSLTHLQFTQSNNSTEESFILKIKEGKIQAVAQWLKSRGFANEMEPVFPRRKPGSRLRNYHRIKAKFSTGEIIKILKSNPDIEILEKEKTYRPLFVPDDPAAQPGSEQWHLAAMSAYLGWDLISPAPNPVITAIIDTGFDLSHEDLANTFYTNDNDPVDGIDNDNDGYIDNFIGWDFGDNDNDPSSLSQAHGTIVAGAGFAAANNTLGGAGTGYNSKYMPIKIHSTALNELTGAYEAIVYAVEQGAKVINLSWGDAGEYSQFEQDIINYAAIDFDAVIIAAAGNTNEHLAFYPASYENVLSIGSTNSSDQKTDWGTISEYIDLSAPGIDIYTTQPSNGYANSWGSSLAAPLVSGLAALVRQSSPLLNALQVMEKIRVSADDIYSVPGNENFFGLLGKGRVNMRKALESSAGPVVRAFIQPDFIQPFYDDSLHFEVVFKNFLDPISSPLTIALNTLSSNITMVSQSITLNSLNTLETSISYSFSVKIDELTPPSEFLQLYFSFESGAYVDFQMLPFRNGPDFIEFNNEKITWTANSTGHLGYFDDYYNGHSLRFQNIDYGWHAGIIAATDASHVSGAVINDFVTYTQDDDFETIRFVKSHQTPYSDIDYRLRIEEKPSATAIGIRIDEKLLGWKNAEDQDFMILEYRVTNLNPESINGFDFGMFLDIDLEDYAQNKTSFSSDSKLGYIYSDNEAFGIALLTNQNPVSRGIDFGNFNGNVPDIGITFGDTEKFQFMNEGLTQTDAGVNGSGNDVAIVFGAVIPVIAPLESVTIAFSIIFGTSLTDLEAKVSLAETRYDAYSQYHPELETFLACEGESAVINPANLNDFKLFSDAQHTDLLFTGNEFITPALQNQQTYYITSLINELEEESYSIQVDLHYANVDFIMSSASLVLHPGEKSSIAVQDITTGSISRTWDFGNGYGSINNDAKPEYSLPGTYNIELTSIDNLGCEERITKQLLVIESYEKPVFPEFIIICYGENLSFSDSGKILNLYVDSISPPVASGSEIFTDDLISDTTFYLTQVGLKPESLPTRVDVIIENLMTGFDFSIDTTHFESPTVLQLNSETPGVSSEWYLGDTYLGSGDTQIVNYSGLNELLIKQRVASEFGCLDSLVKFIPLKISPAPKEEIITICQNSFASLIPEPGSIFVFYNSKNEIIQKGRYLELTNLDRDSIFYFTSIDSLLESAPAKFEIKISFPNSGFTPLKDTLMSNGISQIEFQAEEKLLSSYSWDFSSAGFSSVINPTVSFLLPGLYPVQLTVTDSLGCNSTTLGSVLVADITSFDESDGTLIYFPNPVRNNQFFISGLTPGKVEILDLTGKGIEFQITKMPEGVMILLNENTSNGIYLVNVISSQHQKSFRIQVEN